MADSKFNLSSSAPRNAHELPSEYKFLKVLGAGGFGKVMKCWKKDTKQTVAVKIPKFHEADSTEVSMMERLMRLKLDQQNIIKFFGWFDTSCGKALVFESLDITVEEYIIKKDAPMLLGDISTIIQQLATAFNALQSIGLIHTDLKPDNIMMVDHKRRPFRVKLIDFGLAIHRSKAKQGDAMQVVYYRAPEIMLGLPFSEAIDMWALGCVMGTMLLGGEVFTGDNEYEALQDIIALMGVPADNLLKDGQKTERYFTKTECNSWRLKTHDEYWKKCPHKQYQTEVCFSLDDLRRLRLEKKNKSEAVERRQCIDLLEAMLDLDEAERITPIGVLTHPFIRRGQKTIDINNNRFRLAKKKRNTHPDSLYVPPGVIMVRPAAAMNKVQLESDEETSDESPAKAAPNGDNRHPDHRSTAAPSGVIMVRPAATENTLQTDDVEITDSRQPVLMKTFSVTATDGDTAARTSGDTKTKKDKKDKKKKNLVKRVFSWMKKTFGSCCSVVEQDEEADE